MISEDNICNSCPECTDGEGIIWVAKRREGNYPGGKKT